jgi:hypothetical protein
MLIGGAAALIRLTIGPDFINDAASFQSKGED